MIEGTNPDKFNQDVDQDEFFSSEVLSELQRRRDNIINGGINCIPLPFQRFSEEFPGLEHELYIVFTAGTKVGKTQIASFVCIYNSLEYAFEHPDQCSVDILYNNLEESKERIYQRYISYLLYKLNKIRLSPRDLRSTSKDYPLPQAILDLLQEEKYQARLRYFDEHVHFNNIDTNPTGILNRCKEYAKTVGEYKERDVVSHDGSGRIVKEFISYKLKDPKHYTIVFTDHVRLLDREKGMTQKETIDKYSEYCIKYLRDRLHMTVVNIQQQAFESEGLEAIKLKRTVPSVAGLGDSKYTSQDANCIIGLFDPNQFGFPAWLGYKIQEPTTNIGLKNYARFMYMLRGRDGEQGGICPLFFDGATCNFEELPRPDENIKIKEYYDLVDKLRSFRQQTKLQQLKSAALSFFIRKFKNKK